VDAHAHVYRIFAALTGFNLAENTSLMQPACIERYHPLAVLLYCELKIL